MTIRMIKIYNLLYFGVEKECVLLYNYTNYMVFEKWRKNYEILCYFGKFYRTA